jgi:hypothetical protein
MRTLFIVVTIAAIPCAYVGSQAKIVYERNAWVESHAKGVLEFGARQFHKGDRSKVPSQLRIWLGDSDRQLLTVNAADQDSPENLFPEATIVFYLPRDD